MRVGVYARVSTGTQVHLQTIDQQLDRLRAASVERGWSLADGHIFRGDGYSGARLTRPGLEGLFVTAPDRVARNYVHQMVLIEELERQGCAVAFLDRPMRQDPHDQLLLQIRGAVAEYERRRRGHRSKFRAINGTATQGLCRTRA